MSGEINRWVTLWHKDEDFAGVEEAEDRMLPLGIRVEVTEQEDGLFRIEAPGNWPSYLAERDENFGRSQRRRYRLIVED